MGEGGQNGAYWQGYIVCGWDGLVKLGSHCFPCRVHAVDLAIGACDDEMVGVDRNSEKQSISNFCGCLNELPSICVCELIWFVSFSTQ